jgi:hypothetical protein
MALSTSLLIALWGRLTLLVYAPSHSFVAIIGLASTLYNSFLPYLYVHCLSLMLMSAELFFFRLASRGADFGDANLYTSYRNVGTIPFYRFFRLTSLQQVILCVIGIPGAFLAGWAVEIPSIGRKGTLALSSGE